jgi:hypothetical protein
VLSIFNRASVVSFAKAWMFLPTCCQSFILRLGIRESEISSPTADMVTDWRGEARMRWDDGLVRSGWVGEKLKSKRSARCLLSFKLRSRCTRGAWRVSDRKISISFLVYQGRWVRLVAAYVSVVVLVRSTNYEQGPRTSTFDSYGTPRT